MSLFGSLFTGVSALNAQSQSIGMIANNIANVSTTGYKRNTAAFGSFVTSGTSDTSYTPGSVRAVRIQNVDQQGALQQTASSTDLGISGNGFFVVQNSPEGLQESYYTRAGDFKEDEQGYLVNSSGFYLMGWPLDENGNLPVGASDISSLQPVNVSFVGGFTKATSEVTLAVNLAATATQNAFPVGSTVVPEIRTGVTVYDTLGTSQNTSVELVKSQAPTANVTSSVSGLELDDLLVGTVTGIADGDDFNVTVGSGATVNIGITSTTTVQDLLDSLNAVPGLEARLNADGELFIQAQALSTSVAIAVGTDGTPATDLGIIGTAAAPTVPTLYPDSGLENLPANTQGWWKMVVKGPTGVELGAGYLNFNGDGSLNGNLDIDGEQKVTLSNIDWGNGSDPQDIEFKIDRFTQFSGVSTVLFSNQNGADLGLRSGVEIDGDGIVSARFSNGQSSRLYKLPLATFTNPNGLIEASGVAYQENSRSGSYNLREANQGGAGEFQASTLENSNVDLADEFSKMIITQRAYSAGTKIITTVDDMTEELLRLR